MYRPCFRFTVWYPRVYSCFFFYSTLSRKPNLQTDRYTRLHPDGQIPAIKYQTENFFLFSSFSDSRLKNYHETLQFPRNKTEKETQEEEKASATTVFALPRKKIKNTNSNNNKTIPCNVTASTNQFPARQK